VPRALRQAKNREHFRVVNEEIAKLADRFSMESQGFLCECSQIGCAEHVQVPLAVYHQVRETPSAYLVGAGHEDPTAEHPVVIHRSYLIVVARSND
jgi:hypothetical protein